MEIVDAHQHVGSLDNAMGDYGGREVAFDLATDVAARVQGMKALGIDWAPIQPTHGYLRPDGIKDTMRINDLMAEYRRRDPQRFPIALGTVEPLHGERSLAEIDRIKHELKLDGVSWHHRFQGCFIDNKWMRPYLKRMAELNLVAFIHTNAESSMEASWRLQRLALEFPEVRFLALDALWSYERAVHVLSTASTTPNVIWDMGGPHSYVPVTTWVRQNGSKNITFSGDAPYAGRGPARKPRLLEDIERSRMSGEDKANILGGNVRRLFGMKPAPV